MRLLIVTTVSSTLTAFLLPYAEYFRGLGWKVDAMANGAEDCGVCRAHFDDVHEMGWSRNPCANFRLLQMMRRVREVAARERYDVVHVHTPVASFILRMALAGRPKRPRIIYTAHGFHFQPGNNWLANRIYAAAERLAGRTTDLLVTMNRMDQAAAVDQRIVPREKVRYMPGIGLDTNFFRPGCVSTTDVRELRWGFGIRDEAPLFVMIAELHSRKRHEDLIAAFARTRTTEAHLLFVGGGALQPTVEKLAANAGISARVHFAGPRNDVRPYLLAARATVLPSSQEGLPRSIMESLSCGVPVIASDIRGNRDLLEEGGGVLYPVGDIGALVSHLDWFAGNPDQARQMGQTGRIGVGRYSLGVILRQHEQLYAEATGGKSCAEDSAAVRVE
jgi:glycosyltransferase involved in cell wall biosynthesis